MPQPAEIPRDRIILGLMTFGPKVEDGARITDINVFKNALDVFQSRGYNEIDTARVYIEGQQEAFTRQAGWKEKGLTLATKVLYPSNPGDNAADKVAESVETSLKELGTDRVDVSSLLPDSTCSPEPRLTLTEAPVPPSCRPLRSFCGDSKSCGQSLQSGKVYSLRHQQLHGFRGG
jgi:aflatoxin B1 aldehyde reductase